MLASILRLAARDPDAVLATKGNLNNHIGMPLTLLQLRAEHRYAVIEMGMNHPGEIRYLTGIARPTVALINNAQAAHLEGLGSVEAVARAKGEIFEGLGADGVAVINAADMHAPLWQSLAAPRHTLSFGIDPSAQVRAEDALDDGSFTLRAGDERSPVRLRVVGRHNVLNALAAAACAHALGLPTAQIAAGLEAFAGVPGRLGFSRGPRGECIIDDTYNANPASMRAALDVLAAQSGARFFVMGDMGELGGDAPALHREIGAYARQKAIDGLFALGQFTRETISVYGPGAAHFETIEALVDALAPKLDERATVLVKGSRFMGMERVVAALRAQTKKEG
jgi:UDP-N-acetylmuramoyl-tripeptide--D-alanyl-D-alanine ligase